MHGNYQSASQGRRNDIHSFIDRYENYMSLIVALRQTNSLERVMCSTCFQRSLLNTQGLWIPSWNEEEFNNYQLSHSPPAKDGSRSCLQPLAPPPTPEKLSGIMTTLEIKESPISQDTTPMRTSSPVESTPIFITRMRSKRPLFLIGQETTNSSSHTPCVKRSRMDTSCQQSTKSEQYDLKFPM